MKKLLSLIIISLLVMGGSVFASTSYTYENVSILGPNMGEDGQTPPVEIIMITVASDDDAIIVGNVMAWMIEPQITDGNALGVAVNKMRRSMSEDVAINVEGKGPYAGVMVTTATSNDQGATTVWGNSNPMSNSDAIGFMAIRGYCDAFIDVSRSTQGKPLVLHGNPAIGNGGTAGYFATRDGIRKVTNAKVSNDTGISIDIGILLEVPASSDGLHKVWLR